MLLIPIEYIYIYLFWKKPCYNRI